jgi:predicted amidophosphoribosyltransferase
MKDFICNSSDCGLDFNIGSISGDEEKIKYCPHCGSDDISETCPMCGTKIDPDTRVCGDCKEMV